MTRADSIPHLTSRATTWFAVGAWIAAQALPVVDGSSPPGIVATLTAWSGGGVWLFTWSANVWFLVAVALRAKGKHEAAWLFGCMATACAVIGCYMFAVGWPFLLTNYPLGPGAWVWMLAMVALVGAASLQAIADRRRIHVAQG